LSVFQRPYLVSRGHLHIYICCSVTRNLNFVTSGRSLRLSSGWHNHTKRHFVAYSTPAYLRIYYFIKIFFDPNHYKKCLPHFLWLCVFSRRHFLVDSHFGSFCFLTLFVYKEPFSYIFVCTPTYRARPALSRFWSL